MEEVLAAMDAAEVVVMADGAACMRALRTAYGGDEARKERHEAKMHDVCDKARAAMGRGQKPTLRQLAKKNGVRLGAPVDATHLWQRQQTSALETACRGIAVATARLVMRARLTMPDGDAVTSACSTRRSVVDEEPEVEERDQQRGVHEASRTAAARRTTAMEMDEIGGQRDGEEAEAQASHAHGAATQPARSGGSNDRMDGAVGMSEGRIERVDEMEEEVHATGPSLAEQRTRRPGGPATYKEAGQRRSGGHRTGPATGTATPAVRYVDGVENRRRELRLAMEIGPLAVDRMTGGKYEWRDGGLRWTGRGAQEREPG